MKPTHTNFFLLLICIVCIVTSGTAKAQSSRILCGNEIFSDIVNQHYPELREGFENTFINAQSGTHRNNEVYTIPVVVHVVWKNEEENLADSIILDQIRVLNEDFNRRNADTSNLRSLFIPEAGRANIEFQLADIVRVHTDVDFEVDVLGTNLLPEVKDDALGGSDAYDTESYLNIWVCKIQPITIFGLEVGQILGFAFPPNNLPNWPADSGSPNVDEDGVVIDFRVFGSNNPNTIEITGGGGPLAVKGRTPVHEVGHYLGLRHIWGDGGLLGPNDCAQSDGINDTPYANAQSNFDCDITRNTCSQVEPHYGQDVPDLIENYMDYASEECMNMFTHGQVDLMRGVLEGPRAGLVLPVAGIYNLANTLPLRIEPNPTTGSFSVRVDLPQDGEVILQLFNMQGQMVYRVSGTWYAAGAQRLPVVDADLVPGMYLVQVRHANKTGVGRMMVE